MTIKSHVQANRVCPVCLSGPFTLMWRGSPAREGGEESPPTGFTPNVT